MKRGIIHIIFLFFLQACFFSAFSQESPAKVFFDRDKILIGEPIHLVFQAEVPTGVTAGLFTLDSIAHFEFIDKARVDTIFTSKGTIYKQGITITSFDSGQWVIPAREITIGDKQYFTDSVTVSVAYSSFDPNKDYHDIKDIIEVDEAGVQYITWIVLALGIIALLASIYFLRKKKIIIENKPEEAPSKMNALEEALQSLENLKKSPAESSPELKLYYTRLNDILKRYLQRKTGASQVAKTNTELIYQLQRKQWQKDEVLQLAQTLRQADAVKFAKYIPGHSENNEAVDSISKSIQSLDKFLS
jgi:hypothetical protein